MSDVEYVVNFGSDKSIQFVKLSMAEVEHHGARLGEHIVRCRDCKHRHEGMCMLTDGMGDFKRWFVDDDDYCSDGARVVGE